MTNNDDAKTPSVSADRVAGRAVLLPEEEKAGSDDPALQAEIILEDAEQRRVNAIENPRSAGERRTSDEATPPTG